MISTLALLPALLLRASLLASIVTVADRGLLFQPALSPDGTKVAYAVDEGGSAAIYVVEAVGGATPVKVASCGEGALGRRLASKSLLHAPWSKDGTRLLFLAPGAGPGEIRLHVVQADGANARAVGPDVGLVECAAFLPNDRIAFTHRATRGAQAQTLQTVEVGATTETAVILEYRDELVIDIAPSPDGKWIGTLVLSGPRDERVRSLRVVDLQGRREQRLAESTEQAKIYPNFLAWTSDSARLYFVDAVHEALAYWAAGTVETTPGAADISTAIPVLSGLWVLATDPRGLLLALNVETGMRHVVGANLVATSATESKVALVRRGAEGAAILVADLTRERLEAGDIGLPKPPAPPTTPAEPTVPTGPGTESGAPLSPGGSE